MKSDLFSDFVFLILGFLFVVIFFRSLFIFTFESVLTGLFFLIIGLICLNQADVF